MTKIMVEKNKVIQAANALLISVQVRRADLREQGIEKYMTRSWENWFPSKTRVGAIGRLDREDFGWPDYKHARGGAKAWADGILKVCSLHMEKNIGLDKKDAWWVSEGLEVLESMLGKAAQH